MTRFIRIALIVLCITTCVGTAFAVSAPADMSSMVGTHLCNQPCLTSGIFCTSATSCPDVRNLKKACCNNECVYCL